MELILTGSIDRRARGGRAHGLVTRVVPAEATVDAALELAARIAAMPPLAVRAAKAAVLRGRRAALAAGWRRARGLLPALRHRGPGRGDGRLHREAAADLVGPLTTRQRQGGRRAWSMDTRRQRRRVATSSATSATRRRHPARHARPTTSRPIDATAPVSGHVPPPEPAGVDRRRAGARLGARPDAPLPGLPAGRDAGPGHRVDRPRRRWPAHGRQSHAQPLLDQGPAGLPVVYTLDAGGFDIVVNGDHLLSWGVEPADDPGCGAWRNLAAWSATARRGPTRCPASGGCVSSETGDGWDAARILLPDVRRSTSPPSSGPHGRILVGIPERHLLTAGSLRPGDDEFAALFADFIVEQSGGADEPIDRRVFELVGRPAGRVRRAGQPGLMGGDRRPPFGPIRLEVADAIATVTLDRPDALNALTVPDEARSCSAAFRAIGRRPRGPGGRPDRRRPRVLRRPGPQGAARARRRAARRRAARALQPDHPGDARAATSRSSARSTGWPPAPARRSPSPATSGSPPRSASFVLAFGRIGLVPDSGATWFLPRLVGPAKAAELALLGEPLSAADAERFGLVARVVPADELADEARAVAARLAALAPRALALTKRALRAELVARPRGGPRGRGHPPGDRRRDGGPRRGPRRVPREAAAAVHRGVAPLLSTRLGA